MDGKLACWKLLPRNIGLVEPTAIAVNINLKGGNAFFGQKIMEIYSNEHRNQPP